MKLVLFAPMVTNSAITRFAVSVGETLRSMCHDVVMVDCKERGARVSPVAVSLPVESWIDEAKVTSALLSSDIAVYFLGNDPHLYGGGLAWLKRFPGLVLLHDTTVDQLWDAEGATDAVFALALGVVAHSSIAVERSPGACAGPIVVRSAPKPTDRTWSFDASPRQLALRSVDIDIDVAERVIDALGSSGSLRERSVYTVSSLLEPRSIVELSAHARRRGVRLVVTDRLTDTELQWVAVGRDLFVQPPGGRGLKFVSANSVIDCPDSIDASELISRISAESGKASAPSRPTHGQGERNASIDVATYVADLVDVAHAALLVSARANVLRDIARSLCPHEALDDQVAAFILGPLETIWDVPYERARTGQACS